MITQAELTDLRKQAFDAAFKASEHCSHLALNAAIRVYERKLTGENHA